MFGFSILSFTAFNVIDISYKQVLIPVNKYQLLLKLEILDMLRLVTKHNTKKTCNVIWFILVQEKREFS